MKSCSLCSHLTSSRYCPEAHDVVPVDFVDRDNDCASFCPVKVTDLIALLLQPGALLQPLWEIGEALEEASYIDAERLDIAIQRLMPHAKNPRISFIIDEALKISL